MSENCNHDCNNCNEQCEEKNFDFHAKLNELSSVKKVIGVVSGKGGVGKSLVTSLLAVSMRREGYNVGIIDADITGPSITKMFGIHSKAEGLDDNKILPAISKGGVNIMSISLFLQNETDPVVWRGPILAGAIKQFWSDVVWRDIDFLFVDMPPGTGDVPLTVFQSLPLTGIVIVTSPQDLVTMIVEKAYNMAKKMDIPILGLVENMSYFECPDCHKKHYIYGESKLLETAKKFNIDSYSQIPITTKYASLSDQGDIEKYEDEVLNEIVEKLISEAEDNKNMTIAVPVENEEIFQHFGKTKSFAIYEIENGQISNKKIVDTNGSGHSLLGSFLGERKVNVVICGGIGSGAVEVLSNNNIEVYSGHEGNADIIVEEFLKGKLVKSTSASCDHHDSEEHSCSNNKGHCCH